MGMYIRCSQCDERKDSLQEIIIMTSDDGYNTYVSRYCSDKCLYKALVADNGCSLDSRHIYRATEYDVR